MKRYQISHLTQYDFSGVVELLNHTLRLRPREGHELRIESSTLEIQPLATLRWHRDVEGNSVAIASFAQKTQWLTIKSSTVIQQYDQAPYDFLVSDYAVNYPFNYLQDDQVLLAPYMIKQGSRVSSAIAGWLSGLWQSGEQIQTFALLQRLSTSIHQSFNYQQREEEGVQTPEQSLMYGTGSCRDFANLFMISARQLGLAARFVSGYIYSAAGKQGGASTHAWTEVFLPGAGWKGFDPTNNSIVGVEHIPVAVAMAPESVSPITGSFIGPPGARMTVNVGVTEISG